MALWAATTAAQGALRPDPAAILARALAAHRGPTPPARPRTLWFLGSATRRTEKHDLNEVAIEQWFAVREGQDTIQTRYQVKGTDEAAIRGFDGRRHFLKTVDARPRITFIDGKPDYKVDLQRIEEALERTRLITNTFLVGNLVGPDTTLEYLGKVTGHGLVSHKIRRRGPGLEEAIFYVDAREGRPPFLLGIEFPATRDQPRRDICLWHFKKFGPFRVPQSIKVFHDDGREPIVEIWIQRLAVNRKDPPAWTK